MKRFSIPTFAARDALRALIVLVMLWAAAPSVASAGNRCKKPDGGNNGSPSSIFQTGEECDDGDSGGDGCNGNCEIEANWTCTTTLGAISVCTANCGNGIKAGSEACDDGNTNPSDGCSAACTVEAGYLCPGSPSVCERCGNVAGSVRNPEEFCDDANSVSGDGCEADCSAFTVNWTCTSNALNAKTTGCKPICGNGVKTAPETCDDGNTNANDGCSALCVLEAGYTCTGSPSTCTATCGNVKTLGEACDDGNTVSGDGCNATCTAIESPNFTCTTLNGVTGTCMAVCGNVKTGTEACDDGNTNPNDGCSAVCAIETGYVCAGSPRSVCERCGNLTTSVRNAEEFCDDANSVSGDGCEADCSAFTVNWTCTSNALNAKTTGCKPICGNGILTAPETCDDGNIVSSDGCSSVCVVETGWACPTQGSPCESYDATKIGIITPGVGISEYSVAYGGDALCGPYMYSDFTGQQLRLASTLRGFYYQTFEGCASDANPTIPTTWATLSWTAVIPLPSTQIVFRGRVANTYAELGNQPWSSITIAKDPVGSTVAKTGTANVATALQAAGRTSGPGLDGRYLQIEVMLESSNLLDTFYTPELVNVSVGRTCTDPVLAAGTFATAYAAADYCVAPEIADWYDLSYKVKIPTGTGIDFEIRTGATPEAMAAATPIIYPAPAAGPITMACPTGCPGQAYEGKVDIGAWLVARGVSSQQAYLEVRAVLKPSGSVSPVLYGFDQEWLCRFAE